MNLQRIKDYCKKHDGGLKKLADEIGMSESSLHRCIRNNEIKAGDLERISNALDVSVQVFFENNTESPEMRTETLLERIKGLENLLTEKERMIQILLKQPK